MRNDNIGHGLKSLDRDHITMKYLTHTWAVLTIPSPLDFLSIHNVPGSASGVKSYQFREIELFMGNKDNNNLANYRSNLVAFLTLQTHLKEPSLYNEVIDLLARHTPLFHPLLTVQQQRWSKNGCGSINSGAITDHFMSWVKNLSILRKASKTDVSLVERIIGYHPGAGGTSGVNYLRSTLDSSFFPELYSMRVQL